MKQNFVDKSSIPSERPSPPPAKFAVTFKVFVLGKSVSSSKIVVNSIEIVANSLIVLGLLLKFLIL